MSIIGIFAVTAIVIWLLMRSIHRILTDNTSTDYYHDFLSDWKMLYGDTHDMKTLIHIPVHAVMKKLYLDSIHRPDLLKFDIDSTKNNAPYAAAWDYVTNHDYNEIVAGLSISKTDKPVS